MPSTPNEAQFLDKMMGRDHVQIQAAQEIAVLTPDNRYQGIALKLLSNLQVQLAAKKHKTSQERNLIMTLSPIFVAQLEQAEQRGIQLGMVLGLIIARFGELSIELNNRLRALDGAKIIALRQDLDRLNSLDDLDAWLAQQFNYVVPV